MYVYIYIYLCDVVLITNQRLCFNTGALLGGTDVFACLRFTFLITGLEKMFLRGGNSVLHICRKWVCACCGVQGLGELVPVSWTWLSIRRDDQGPVFCLLARSDVGASWLCEHLSQPSLDMCLHGSESGEKYLWLYFPESPEWEERSLPSPQLRNGSKKTMTEEDPGAILNRLLLAKLETAGTQGVTITSDYNIV